MDGVAGGGSEVIDAVILGKLRAICGDESDFKMLVHDHLKNGAHLVASMQAALAARDLAGLERHAHSLKGTSAMFGAIRLSDACSSLETAAREGGGDVVSLVDRVVSERDAAERGLLAV